MKKKNVLVCIIVILVVLLLLLTHYTFNVNKNIISEKYIRNEMNVIGNYSYDINYLEEYEENIILENVREVSYSVANDKDVLYGRIFLSSSNKLYISDELLNKTYLLLDEEVETIYKSPIEDNTCSVYAITKSGDLYLVGLTQPYIESYYADKIEFDEKIDRFTDLKINSWLDFGYHGVVFLAKDGNMYDSNTLTKYSPNTLYIFSKYIIYEDGAISDNKKNFLTNSDMEYYEIKSIILSNNPVSELEGNPTFMFITIDNKLIYEYDSKTYEVVDVVSNVNYDSSGKVEIEFKNSKIIVEGVYTSLTYKDDGEIIVS